MCTFFVSFILWTEVQSHYDDCPMHAPSPSSACALAQASPTMSYTHLCLGSYTPGRGKNLPRNVIND